MDDSSYKVVIIGECYCGKTSLSTRIINNYFNDIAPITTGPSIYIKNLVVNNKTICLKILDTSGQTLFRGLNKIFCKNADFVLLIYNITNRSTFNEIKEYHYETMKSIVETASIDIFYNKL